MIWFTLKVLFALYVVAPLLVVIAALVISIFIGIVEVVCNIGEKIEEFKDKLMIFGPIALFVIVYIVDFFQ